MKISIIIPVFNEVNTIGKVIEAVEKVKFSGSREIIVVDDGSIDGTRQFLEKIDDPNLKKVFHSRNQGKGAAIRSALPQVSGDIVIIQDADLEYYPDEFPQLIEPILNKKADIVFGSRFIGTHRCFLFTHYIGNKTINLAANILYNTILTDFMTGHKAFKAETLKNISIRSNRFGFEAEITGMMFRKNFKVYEVPISYSGRDYCEGKKIKWTDFFVCLWWLVYTKFRRL
ncbi:MAG: glycosyltransferase family 2 protein [Candidatus Omnitrophota bacterium]|jgi:glycosyltransferase involved in cell wall biosynthesis